MRYLDDHGEIRTLEAEGLLATVIQHEMDHLEGVLFVDHLTGLKRDMILRKLTKTKRLQAAGADRTGPAARFYGNAGFAVPALRGLAASRHEVLAVYTQPARPAGRGKHARPSAVQDLATSLGLEARTPRTLRGEAEQAAFSAFGADAAVVAAYGLILPKPILDAPRHGCLNIHPSLLPRWRGAAPIPRAVMAGDTETGVCIMQLDEGLDTGPVLASETTVIGPRDTAGDLHDRLAELGRDLMLSVLGEITAGTANAVPQSTDGVTYAAKIEKSETRIDWRRPAAEIDCHIRGLAPVPGAWFALDGVRIKVLAGATGFRRRCATRPHDGR